MPLISCSSGSLTLDQKIAHRDSWKKVRCVDLVTDLAKMAVFAHPHLLAIGP